jgi:hypothetical protein
MTAATTYISEICRLYIAVLLFASAGGKSFTFYDFERDIFQAVGIPARLSRYVALAVIVAECTAALMSAIGSSWAQLGVATAFLLSFLFTGFVLAMLAQAKSIHCNCFGHSNDAISSLDLLRNAFLMASCAFYLLGAPPTHSISAVAYLLLLAIAVLAFLFSANLNGIAYILRYE